MPRYGPPPDIHIASMVHKQAAAQDLMLAGNGTPWEDRGSLGVLPAFVKTCLHSLKRHGLMLDHIRRPETTHEATLFAIGCSAVWTLSFALLDAVRYVLLARAPEDWDVNGQQFLIESAVRAVVAGALVFLLLKLGTHMYGRLIAGGTSHRVPNVLLYNVFAYSLGPSLLAIVPIVGWVIAVPWIFVDVILAGRQRLYLKRGDAIMNACIVFVAAAAIVVALYFGAWFLWAKVISGGPSVVDRHAPVPKAHPQVAA